MNPVPVISGSPAELAPSALLPLMLGGHTVPQDLGWWQKNLPGPDTEPMSARETPTTAVSETAKICRAFSQEGTFCLAVPDTHHKTPFEYRRAAAGVTLTLCAH